MLQKYFLVLIIVYFASFSCHKCQATAFPNPFQNEDFSMVKTIDTFKKSMGHLKNMLENKLMNLFKWNGRSKPSTEVKTKSEPTYEYNSCKCVNFTCSCCAHVEIKRYNISDTGL